MMRSLTFFSLALVICVAIQAQNTDYPDRNIPLKIFDKKGKPVRGIVLQSLITGMGGITDRTGRFVFENMSDNDTISVMMKKNGQIKIPVTGMDSIIVMAKSSKLYSYIDNQGQNVDVTITLLERSYSLDVQELLKRKAYSSLTTLIKEETIWLSARGPISLTLDNEPLVVLDGTDIGNLTEANLRVNVQSIKTIEWQKLGMGWGLRGANGVIVVKTK